MKNLDAIMTLYGNCNDKILVTDKNLNVVWKNQLVLPEYLGASDFMPEFGKALSLPIKSETILQYMNGNSVKVKPLYHNEKIEGYMMTFFDAEEIETLSDRSSILKYKRNTLGNIRLSISPIIGQLDKMSDRIQQDEDLRKLYELTSNQLLKMLSSTVNSNEITKYYSGEFSTELLNISQCLEETANLCRPRFKSAGCNFTTEIQPAIFMIMNYDRLSLAVINLLINGYMYCDSPNKELSLKAYKNGDKVFIEVTDNGKNADIESIKMSLKPFRTLSKFSMRESLGLSVVNKFSDHFKGKLSFNKSDAGFTVKISLDGKINEEPQSFKLKRYPPIIGEYEPAYCILAKGLDPIE